LEAKPQFAKLRVTSKINTDMNQTNKTKIKLLIAPNSFKECADSVEVALMFRDHFNTEEFEITLAPVSDGGDGFLKVCSRQFDLELKKYKVHSPFNTLIDVNAGVELKENRVFIESADIIGLKLIPQNERRPMFLSSAGLGELLKIISIENKVDKFIIGIGGTGINDLGIGMLSELGLKLYDINRNEVKPFPAYFSDIANAEWSNKYDFNFELITDVNNPITGLKGATNTFGRQKGLTPEELRKLDSEFGRLIDLFSRREIIIENKKLSGAGGGIAAGFQMFFNSAVKTSSEFILNDLRLSDMIRQSDFIITGEGSFDEQSLFGKATGVIVNAARTPVFLVCGKINNKIKLPELIHPIELQKYFSGEKDSIKYFREGITKAVKEILSTLHNL
jgi:glycerate 2-kinase